MKRMNLKIISVSTLSLFLGASALMYAQEQHEDTKQQNDNTRPAASPTTREQKAKPAQNEKQGDMTRTQEQNRDRTGNVPEQNEDKATRTEDRAAHPEGSNQGQRSDRNTSDRNTQERNAQSERNMQSGNTSMQSQKGRRSGGHIPDDKFRSQFGRQHTFKVNRPTAVGGQPQFQYGGYAFEVVDAWPSDWSYSDEVYVDYINDEYVLFDLAHPGVSVALVVVM
jgi:hypothetical protein